MNKSKSDTKLERTHAESQEIIAAQKTARDKKTLRLRDLRLAQEAEIGASRPVAKPTKTKKKAA